MTKAIKLICRVPKTQENLHGYEDITEFVLSKPTVIMFGGDDTEESQAANGYAKVVQMLLTGNKEKFPRNLQLLSAYYENHNSDSSYLAYLMSDRKDHYLHDESINQLFNQQFLPLISSINSSKLAIEQVKKNFRNVNIVTHSYGGFIAEQLGNMINYRMNEMGYSEEEVNSAMKQISLLTLGNIVKLENTNNKFTTLHVLNQNDIVVNQYVKEQDKKPNGNHNDSSNYHKVLQTGQALWINEHYGLIAPVFSIKNHEVETLVNFSVGEDGEIKATQAAGFLSKVVNNSDINSRSEKLVELPDVTKIFNKSSYQIRVLERKFKQVHNMYCQNFM